MPWLRQTDDGVIISLYAQPRASRNQLTGVVGDEMKVRLTSAPVDGAANQLCLKYFAKLLGQPASALRLIAGERSRHKRLLVSGETADRVRRILNAHLPDNPS